MCPHGVRAPCLAQCLIIKGRLLRLNWATRSEESGTSGFNGPEGPRRIDHSRDTKRDGDSAQLKLKASGSGEKRDEAGDKAEAKGEGEAGGVKAGGAESTAAAAAAETPAMYHPVPLPPVPGLPAGAPVAPVPHMPPMPQLQGYQPPPPSAYHQQPASAYAPPPVSYTHLTLPTICSV